MGRFSGLNWLERRREYAKLREAAGPSLYEDRPRPQPEVDDDAGWTKIAELDPATGQPMPGTVPAGDWKETLFRQGWEPLEDRLRRRF